ncbi:elastase-like isoform X2 [Mercenaria mercenaria]|uniref:elastase-like isoform X2 n=1 Tax=Mercenaria mercenaria TaxID=6596 RepID=UPI00234FA623|nr:elastase-like isoform X2 [Mercenaria mercenaria]
MASKSLILALITVQLIAGTWAAKRVDAHLRARETMKRRRSQEEVLQRRDETPLDTTELFQLSEGESLIDVLETNDVVGTTVERLEETYKGIPVYDAVVTVRKTKGGQLTGDASGTLIQNIDEDLSDTKAKLTDRETLLIAVEAEGDDIEDVVNEKYSRTVYIDKKDKARLANIVSYLVDGVKRPFSIIDANSGDMLEHWQGLNTYPCCTRNYKAWGGNVKEGRITYGDMPHCLSPTIDNGTCYLENKYVRVVDMQNSFNETITETASFPCEMGYGDEVNGAYSPAIDAFFYGTVVGKMFEEWFGSTALKSRVVLRVHFGDMFQNAFWNGENTTFGDGGFMMYPLTSLDVVSHEVGHGVTEQGSNLEYRGEPGGINEAFSDIMGEAAEDYLLNSDYVTGYSIMKDLPYMREFERPENDNRSIGHVDDMNEHEDPHFSSGVYRRIWWVLTKDAGMSIRDAATVFLHANRMYWHSTASFYDCSCGTLKAALDLGHDTAPFRMAFKDVGIEDCDVDNHVFGLNNNDTQRGVLVSGTVNPVFKMETPEWADSVIVDVTTSAEKRDINIYSGAEILITVMTNGWELSDDECESAVVVAEGINHVVVPDAADQEYFFKLSVTNDTLILPEVYNHTSFNSTGPVYLNEEYMVDLTVGYTCQQNFTTDYMGTWMYSRDCGIELGF